MSSLQSYPRSTLRIFLADDHSLILEGLKVLVGAEDNMCVVGEAMDGEEAVRLVAECQPDVVVMDVSMPRMGGLLATSQICSRFPAVKVLPLSMHEDATYLRGLLEAGASGYILKRSAPQELVRAIRYVASGGAYLDPAIAGKVATVFHGKSPLRGDVSGMTLSEREEAVIRQVALGYTNREIAGKMNLSIKTVETYRARAMEKLELATRADLVRLAAFRGWLND